MTGPQRWAPSGGWLLLALAAGALAPLLWWWGSGSDPAPMAAPAPVPTTTAATASSPLAQASPALPLRPLPMASAAGPAPPPAGARRRDPDGDPTPDLADVLNPGELPSMAEVIARLNAAGVFSGLGAFQPPGTRPPLIGLAVPEGFELPPGYVRHHQATDDGQRIEAILMFAPDAVWVDAQGRAVALPPDRVVPPEMAPPGLPIRRIVVPAPLDGGKGPGR